MKKLVYFIIMCMAVSCSMQKQTGDQLTSLDPAAFDTTVDGKPVKLYSLKNDSGITVYLTNYGARIVGVITPDRDGELKDIALGFDNINDYLNDKVYLGPVVGRFANRIKDGRFSIGKDVYDLQLNDGDNTLHGGLKGIDKRVWDASLDNNSVTFSYLSPDGEEGYPGNLNIKVTYKLQSDNTLSMYFEAETDKPTHVNLCNHAYWNLKGEGDSTILDHFFLINADSFVPVDNEWIPSGVIAPVENTPFDFRTGKKIGQDIAVEDEQLLNGLGYDHNWVLNKPMKDSLSLAAKLWEETTGRYIEIYTTEPGMQFYSGNFLKGQATGKSGKKYTYRSSLVFETQHYPDSPNHPDFPNTLLNPGEKYTQLTLLKFGAN